MGIGGTRRRLTCFAAAVSLACALPASAADTPKKKKPKTATPAPDNTTANNKSRAAELYKKSADAYLKGDFETAIKLLDEAYALDPQPVLVYNQAKAHEGLGHVDQAIALYESYLSQEPNSSDRGAIEQRLATLKKQKEEKERVEKDKADVAAKQEQQKEQEQALEAREREAAKPPPERKRSVLPYVVAGVGVAGIATGTVFGVLALKKQDSGNSATNLREATDARDSGQTFATVSNVSFIVGGVLLAGGVVWWILDGRAKNTGSALPPTTFAGTF